MRFKSINTTIHIGDNHFQKNPLEISAYIEQDIYSRNITINISPEEDTEQFDIFLDLDIYQAELFAIKIQQLVNNRKNFLQDKLIEK